MGRSAGVGRVAAIIVAVGVRVSVRLLPAVLSTYLVSPRGSWAVGRASTAQRAWGSLDERSLVRHRRLKDNLE